jgi:type II secretory pathway component GspD/PulD (secretin)
MSRLLLVMLFCAACAAPTSPAAKPNSDLWVQVVKLEHASADDVAKALEKTLSNGLADAGCKVVVQSHQNAVVVSGTTAQVREVLEAVARLDVRSAR